MRLLTSFGHSELEINEGEYFSVSIKKKVFVLKTLFNNRHNKQKNLKR